MDHSRRFLAIWLGVIVLAIVGCGRGVGGGPAAAAKIPVTCASEDARQAFLAARELAENLRATDAHGLYRQAVAADDSFAWAHLGLATTSTSVKEFFEELSLADDLAAMASDGERLLIQSVVAGVNGEPERQRSLLEELVAAYPEDERAHNQLGLYHFARQEWAPAVDHLRRATEIEPAFAPAYNQLGYAYRFMGNVAAAEQAFTKYIELIPDEPNPYDSYAELLMQTGRFSESIAQYTRALELNPQFVASFVGIGNNRMLMGDFDAARRSFEELEAAARTDGERRLACTWLVFAALHQERYDDALAEIHRRYVIAEAAGDRAAMSGDLNAMGQILLAAGRPDDALARFEEAVAMAESSNATDDVKQATRRNHLANLARTALARFDLELAKATTEEYRRQVEQHDIAFEVWQSHELAGLIALAEGDPHTAVAELERANRQDARVMLATARALEQAGDREAAREMYARTAHFNTLNQAPLNYALVRREAMRRLAE